MKPGKRPITQIPNSAEVKPTPPNKATFWPWVVTRNA